MARSDDLRRTYFYPNQLCSLHCARSHSCCGVLSVCVVAAALRVARGFHPVHDVHVLKHAAELGYENVPVKEAIYVPL